MEHESDDEIEAAPESDDEEDDEEEEEEEEEEGDSENASDIDSDDEAVETASTTTDSTRPHAAAVARAAHGPRRAAAKIIEAANRARTYRFVPPDQRRTSHVVSQQELAALLSSRAGDIGKGRESYAQNALPGAQPVALAALELMQRRCPLLLFRTVEETDTEIVVESWNPNEMVHFIDMGYVDQLAAAAIAPTAAAAAAAASAAS